MAVAPAISNAAARAMLDALTALLDAGSYVQILDGTRPAGPDVAISTQNVLAEFAMGTPPFGAAVDINPGARATANAIADDISANASGTATWFRAFNSANVAVIDGNVATSNADLVLDDTGLVAGQLVKFNSWTITQPES